MYDKYFYSKNVDKGLLSSEFRTETIESYMFRIINLHNKNRQLGSLKGLKDIYSTIDLPHIMRGGLKDTDSAFKIACEVMGIILLSIDPIKPQSQDGGSDSQDGDSQEGNGSDGSNTISDEELQDMIDSGSLDNPTPPLII